VMLTHRNLVANILQSTVQQPVTADDTLVGVLPLFHIYGLSVVMNAVLRNGATLVTMPRFDLEGYLALVQEHRATKAHLVPPIVLALAKSPLVERYDLSSLELVNSGAAPLSAELQQAAAERIGCPVVQGYGMTESSPVTHVTPLDPARHRLGSIGPPVPSTECRIVDVAGGEELGPGDEGEVCVRGPQVMRGYLDDPEATAATVDEDGWLHTGDVGRADEDGYVVLVDRVKELIKYKGYQVAPAELEAVLVEHPAVAEAAVVGRPDEEAGEVPKAFVALAGEATEEEIMAFVAERVAPYKKLRALEVVDEIPKSPSGKILRRVLNERDA
jgi:acyl-CoA synthetase (AMP-forming)/AMP-acid ligase II